jgi:hypothetical protein
MAKKEYGGDDDGGCGGKDKIQVVLPRSSQEPGTKEDKRCV